MDSTLRRSAALAYSLGCYAATLATFVYLAGFVGNILVPRSLDGVQRVSTLWAILIDTGLIALFGLQHSVMARPGFKQWWTRFVPKPIERATYSLFSCLALGLLFLFWQPIGPDIWRVESGPVHGILLGLYALGWAGVLSTSFAIQHFDLFGLRQAYLYFRGRPNTPLRFVMPLPYRYVRHPLYVGWLVVFWSTPIMTAAHLVLAVGMTAYILIAIPLEERDLEAAHGDSYREYRERVPALLPRLK